MQVFDKQVYYSPKLAKYDMYENIFMGKRNKILSSYSQIWDSKTVFLRLLVVRNKL